MSGHRTMIYESIIRDMSEGIMTIDLNGVIDSFNPAAEQILETKKDEVIGKRFADFFITNQDNDIFNQTVLDAIYDPKVRHEKMIPWYSGGQVKQLYMVTSFLYYENEKIGTIIVFSDITELAELKVRYAQDIETLLDSLVKALSTAIDERSHYNAKHTQNMVKMAEAFLDWMESNGNPWKYDATNRRAFIMSVALHDVGKLSVPLTIMDKSSRLGPRLEILQDRFTKLNLLNRIAMLEGRITDDQYEKAQREADENLEFIRRVNTTGTLQNEDLERIQQLSRVTFMDENGTEEKLLTEEETTMLSIRKGTLTTQERSVMKEHVVSTWNILKNVRFPDQYAEVPKWAASHHELLNATGYFMGMHDAEIPREVRLLTILDIFEALTSKDRPYKPPIPLEGTWSIMDNMVQEGALDGEILSEFRESRAWEKILEN